MQIINSAELDIDNNDLTDDQVYWLYNGLDCGITHEVHTKLKASLDDVALNTFRRTQRLQPAIMDMMLHGLHVDIAKRDKLIKEMKGEIFGLRRDFEKLCVNGFGLPRAINPNSPKDVHSFVYDVLGLSGKRKRKAGGTFGLTTERSALEELQSNYFAELPIAYILAIRDVAKALSFLQTPLDADGRMRTSLNLAGTVTGRLASAFSELGTGRNLQNIDRRLREIFRAPPGKIFINLDLEQADSRNLGAICWNMFLESHGEAVAGSYLNACESGDLHTTVCRLAWPEVAWGDDPKLWRKIADQIFYREMSYRDTGKRLGHGTNYYGQPPQMAKQTRIPEGQVRKFQANYFQGFPCIPLWHGATIEQLQTHNQITTQYGRRRFFFNRTNLQRTINAAIAYEPQSMTGEEINDALFNIWQDRDFQLCLQVHDSLLMLVDYDRVEELVPKAMKLATTSMTLKNGREFSVPIEAKTGFNFGDASNDNPNGVAKWRGSEPRKSPYGNNKFNAHRRLLAS